MNATKLSKSSEENERMVYELLQVIATVFDGTKMKDEVIDGVRVPILHPDMFKKANLKAMQAIFYSLIWLMDKAKSKDLPYPVAFKEDTLKFRKGVLNFITRECADFFLPKLASSFLTSTTGDKYIQFMLDFTQYAMKRIIHKHFGVTVLNKPSNKPENQQMLLNICNQMDKNERTKVKEYEHFVNSASNMAKEMLFELETVKAELESETNALRTGVENNPNIRSDIKPLFLDVKTNYSAIKEWCKEQSALRAESIANSVLITDEEEEKINQLIDVLKIHNFLISNHLDCSEISIKNFESIGNFLSMKPEDCKTMLYPEGKLSLLNMITLADNILKKFNRIAGESNLTEEYRNLYSDITNLINKKKVELAEAQKMLDNIDQRIQQKQLNIEKLKKENSKKNAPEEIKFVRDILTFSAPTRLPPGTGYKGQSADWFIKNIFYKGSGAEKCTFTPQAASNKATRGEFDVDKDTNNKLEDDI